MPQDVQELARGRVIKVHWGERVIRIAVLVFTGVIGLHFPPLFARVCSELAAGLSGPLQTGETGSLLNWR